MPSAISYSRGGILLWMNYSLYSGPGTHCLQTKMLPGMLEVQEDSPGSLARHIRDLSIEGDGGKLNSVFSRAPRALGYHCFVAD